MHEFARTRVCVSPLLMNSDMLMNKLLQRIGNSTLSKPFEEKKSFFTS